MIIRLHGCDALAVKRTHDHFKINKYADPVDDLAHDIDLDFAEEVARDDAGLLWLDLDASDVPAAIAALAAAGREHVYHVDEHLVNVFGAQSLKLDAPSALDADEIYAEEHDEGAWLYCDDVDGGQLYGAEFFEPAGLLVNADGARVCDVCGVVAEAGELVVECDDERKRCTVYSHARAYLDDEVGVTDEVVASWFEERFVGAGVVTADESAEKVARDLVNAGRLTLDGMNAPHSIAVLTEACAAYQAERAPVDLVSDLRAAVHATARKITAARAARGWSLRDLGERSGVAFQQIGRVEQGTAIPRYDTLERLEAAFQAD